LKPDWWSTPFIQEQKYQKKNLCKREAVVVVTAAVISSLKSAICDALIILKGRS
jgi:hypothetical protein